MTLTTPTTIESDSQTLLLKTDVLGRVKMPREKREALLDEFEKSGMSGQEFARWAGLKYTTFANWTQKRRKVRGLVGQARSVEWVEARLPEKTTDPQTGHSLLIQLPGGARMEVTGIGQVSLAVEVLRRLGGMLRAKGSGVIF